jgi:predicted SnoaL-like aldol condensation-catalyzing enzyme
MPNISNESTAIRDRNKEAVLELFRRVIANHEVDAADELIREDYIQHNPALEPGRAGFKKFFNQFLAQYSRVSTEILRVVAEGDMVAVQSISRFWDKNGTELNRAAAADFWRLKDGQLAEHWDVLQVLPPLEGSRKSD